jgi:hypothetical protein
MTMSLCISKAAANLLGFLFLCLTCKAFPVLPFTSRTNSVSRNSNLIQCQAARREFLSHIGISSLVFLPTLTVSAAAEEDGGGLISKLFNPDGSVKEGVQVEAKERTVAFSWDVSDKLALSVDGTNQGDTKSGTGIRLSYILPQKWSDGSDGDVLYFDRSEGANVKACKRITVYQAPGLADMSRLEKAATVGVAKSLDVPADLKRLYSADLISGRTSKRNGQTYYEFDMATAPDTCTNSKENLGLGFCPYDNIFLLSATIVNDRLYVISVECDSSTIWKLASAELKRVRSSLMVEEA